LKIIGVREGDILEEIEKIEHNVIKETVGFIMQLVMFMQENQECLEAFKTFQKKTSSSLF
jgi:Mn-dependent DtxR family transcriptional regulator